MGDAVKSLLESFRDPGFEPRAIDNYTIANMPEDPTIKKKNRTFGIISYSPNEQKLNATVSKYDGKTYVTTASSFDITRSNPAIGAERLTVELVEQAFANISGEQAQVSLHNMYVEVYKFDENGEVRDEATLTVLPVVGGEGYTTTMNVVQSKNDEFGSEGNDITNQARAAQTIDAANIFGK